METVRVPSLLEHQMENHFDVSGPHEVSLSRSPTVASALYCQCSAGCQQRFHREWPPEVSVWPLPRWCLCLHRGVVPSENPLHSTRSWTPQPKLHPHPDLKCSVNIGSQCCKSKCTHQGMKYKVGSMECVCVCIYTFHKHCNVCFKLLMSPCEDSKHRPRLWYILRSASMSTLPVRNNNT